MTMQIKWQKFGYIFYSKDHKL